MILCIGATPAAQRVMVFPRLAVDSVNRAAATYDGAAGKSINVAKMLRILGEQTLAAGFIGGDRGEFIRSELKRRLVECRFVKVEPRTRECVTVVDRQSGAVTELVEESRPVAVEAYARLRATIRRTLPKCRAMILSGTLTPEANPDFYRECVEMAAAAGVLSVVDAQGEALLRALEAKPGLVKPNRAELAATTGLKCGTETATLAAMRVLHERGARQVVVTAGSAPALAFDGTRCWRIIPPAIAALNSIGSGDAFTAGLVLRLLKGDDLGRACRWAAAAGAANALSWMPGEADPAEVHRLATEARIEVLA